MKKSGIIILLLSGMILTAQSSLCQTRINMNFIGRLNENTLFPLDGSNPDYNWLGSDIFSTFHGSFGKHFSLVVVNHWATSLTSYYPYGDTPRLYENIFETNHYSFLNILYASLKFGRWRFNLGKDILAIGGFEFNEWEWNYPYYLYSTFSGLYTGYQWGGSVSYSTASDKSKFTLQAASSPFSYVDSTDYAIPWYRGTGSYFFKYEGRYGIFHTVNSIGIIQKYTNGDRANQMNIVAGAEVNLLKNTVSIGCEYLNGFDINIPNSTYQHILLTSKYNAPSKKWSIFGKFGYEQYYGSSDCFGGAMVSYWPLKNKKDLRLEGIISAYSWFGYSPTIAVSVGATYILPVHFECRGHDN